MKMSWKKKKKTKTKTVFCPGPHLRHDFVDGESSERESDEVQNEPSSDEGVVMQEGPHRPQSRLPATASVLLRNSKTNLKKNPKTKPRSSSLGICHSEAGTSTADGGPCFCGAQLPSMQDVERKTARCKIPKGGEGNGGEGDVSYIENFNTYKPYPANRDPKNQGKNCSSS